MSHEQADIGVVGLGVMGRNLALNFADSGFTVAVYNREPEWTDAFMDGEAGDKAVLATKTYEEFVAAIRGPKAIFVMISAGDPVDYVLEALAPLLTEGDTVVDGGNSHFEDTNRRFEHLAKSGIRFVGAGVSGGEEGARNGPSIMVGGDEQGWARVSEILLAASAKVGDAQEPCCAYLGAQGAGHFVKMIHNGIEYADMQLIAEVYTIMERALGMGHAAMGEAFSSYNDGALSSYLIEITADIMRATDPDTGEPMLDVILDRAGQKGTGRWASTLALEMGIPAPTMLEAVFARTLSSFKEQRVAAQAAIAAKVRLPEDPDALSAALPHALLAGKFASYAQGYHIIQAASAEHGWGVNLATVSRIWRGGCIIRADFLDDIAKAYEADADLPNLLMAPFVRRAMERGQMALREVVSAAALAGIPAPG
ncbi:MAG: NADP-dependent phosphogluconate dehydrogenase, partial [Myxococcota bacterium]